MNNEHVLCCENKFHRCIISTLNATKPFEQTNAFPKYDYNDILKGLKILVEFIPEKIRIRALYMNV